MTDETAPKGDTPTPEYEFRAGDKVFIPTHNGKYVASVVHCYPNLDAACEEYKGSYRTILQSPFGKAKPAQPYYYCEVDNSTRKPLGVAQEHASLKWREPETADAAE
jgi:hypothetical protein